MASEQQDGVVVVVDVAAGAAAAAACCLGQASGRALGLAKDRKMETGFTVVCY